MDLNPHALRVIRERSGLSVSALARRAGVSQPHLSNIESGRRHASPAVARRLADALEVPLLALVTAVGPDGPAERDPAQPDDPDETSVDPASRSTRPRTQGAAMSEPIVEPHRAPGVQVPALARRGVSVGPRRAVATAAALAALGTVVGGSLPAQAAESTFYTGGCSVQQSSTIDNATYFRSFQARIVGLIDSGTGQWVWDHYDYRYTVDPHLSFGPHSNESVSFQHGYKSGLSNPWASPDSHGTSGDWIGEPGWKGIHSNHNGTVVDFYAAFDIPGTPDPHCHGVTATV